MSFSSLKGTMSPVEADHHDQYHRYHQDRNIMIKIYDTKTRTKREFVPVNEGKVGMYVCGPTVYNYIHIGT